MKLRDYLAATATSHAAFATRIGVSQAAVSRYVSGARIPGPAQMARIAAATAGAVTANDFYPAAAPSPAPGFAERGQQPIETPRPRMVAKPMTPEREAAMARWREENAEATRSFNEHIERDGIFGEKLRRW